MTASTASIPPSYDAEARRYSGVAMALHGLIALGIVAQIGLGWYMGTLEGKAGKAVEAIHIPLGLTVLMLTVLRLAWRLIHRPPAMPAGLKSWEKHMAEAVHVLFYGLMLAIPLTGWFMESIGPRPLPFWAGTAFPHFPGVSAIIAGQNKREIKDTLEFVHGTPLVWATIALVALHVVGAIKHQFDGNPVLYRMIPFFKRH